MPQSKARWSRCVAMTNNHGLQLARGVVRLLHIRLGLYEASIRIKGGTTEHLDSTNAMLDIHHITKAVLHLAHPVLVSPYAFPSVPGAIPHHDGAFSIAPIRHPDTVPVTGTVMIQPR